jgi:hypothetical protein
MSKRMSTLLGFLVFATAVAATQLIEEGRGSSDPSLILAGE